MIWTEISIDVPPSQAESAADVVLRHCPSGFQELASRGRRRVLRAYLAPDRQGLARLRQEVMRAAPSARISTRRLGDGGWQEAWKKHARPVRAGRVTVLPTWWKEAVVGAGVPVWLDPGMAFGSGAHPTTRLCLAAIDRHTPPGISVIDVGTGSGVLAIAAARLGARRVVAIDCDPIAIGVATENVARNRVGARVTLRLADSLAGVRAPADLIVANLTAVALPPFLPDVRRLLMPGGRLVASGFGASKARAVWAEMASAGLEVVGVDRLSGWCALVATPMSSPGSRRAGPRRPRIP